MRWVASALIYVKRLPEEEDGLRPIKELIADNRRRHDIRCSGRKTRDGTGGLVATLEPPDGFPDGDIGL
jgi:hypothetical protein